jgi:hypothetical protein
MTLRIGRLIVAIPLAELLAVGSMIVLGNVANSTLDATTTARILAVQRLALWTAPTAGFVFCVLGGWWVARRATAGHERNGVVLGVAVAIIDLGLLIVSGAPFGLLMVTSAAGRVVGGWCGGLLAKRRVATNRSAIHA